MEYLVMRRGSQFCATVTHPSINAAKSEAIRLCKKEGKPFVIAMLVDEVSPGDPVVKSLLTDDDPAPKPCSTCQVRGKCLTRAEFEKGDKPVCPGYAQPLEVCPRCMFQNRCPNLASHRPAKDCFVLKKEHGAPNFCNECQGFKGNMARCSTGILVEGVDNACAAFVPRPEQVK